MITISLFALLALALTLLVWGVQLLRNNRAQEELINTLLERVEVQEELILHKTQEIKTLQEAVFETKESTNSLLESYQEELDVAQDCIWDKQQQISDKMDLLNEIAEELFSVGLQDTIKANDVFKIRELALGQDIPF